MARPRNQRPAALVQYCTRRLRAHRPKCAEHRLVTQTGYGAEHHTIPGEVGSLDPSQHAAVTQIDANLEAARPKPLSGGGAPKTPDVPAEQAATLGDPQVHDRSATGPVKHDRLPRKVLERGVGTDLEHRVAGGKRAC